MDLNNLTNEYFAQGEGLKSTWRNSMHILWFLPAIHRTGYPAAYRLSGRKVALVLSSCRPPLTIQAQFIYPMI